MATRFGSAGRRQYWTAVAIGLAVDFAIALCIGRFISSPDQSPIIPAIWIMGAVYLVLFGYWVVGFIRSLAIHFVYGKEQRIQAVLDDMARVKMPVPQDFYESPEEYLKSVVMADEASNDAKLMAGATIGHLEAIRSAGQFLATMTTLSILEEAIRRYGLSLHQPGGPLIR